ncbi:hypothetical protein M2G93_21570 [Vibrio vulnificus]|nr:hypothetical protein [Vibrio vulnificus]MCJ0819563.1 hypothetical protein [Vibrio vulnificus]MCU8150701.1 hypothetical protein [Vibrio vulnificus]MCU8199240.1 hypothetical protein [Vibrio vulnificus]
MAFSLCVGFSD